MKEKKFYKANSVIEVFEIAPDSMPGKFVNKSRIWVESSDFSCDAKLDGSFPGKDDGSFVYIGFDTEYKTPGKEFTGDEIRAGDAKYRVLSYQFHCKTSEGAEWLGICCPEGNERISLGEFIVFALSKGVRKGHVLKLPQKIFLVAHFSRADVPAFSDFKTLPEWIASVRNTFITIDGYLPVQIDFGDGTKIGLKVILRDTMLLSPGTSKSLAALGDLVGQKKLVLDPDKAKEKWWKQNMDVLRRDNWELFKKYALNDATICIRYIDKIKTQYQELTGKQGIPPTLTSIGVELLLQSWQDVIGVDPLEILGREQIVEKYWDKAKGRYIKEKKEVDIQEVDWWVNLVTECYHGGRNEEFWFGPAFGGVWTDYDLSSAYPTAMSLIGKPRWKEIRQSLDANDFTPTTLGFACIEFEFPETVRYPTLPIRTDNGIIFPTTGSSYCTAPEIWLARKLGAKLKVRHGVIVPTDGETKIFGKFITDCLDKRGQYPKKSIDALFWKEISNSTYGKTAQGLKKRRIYDMRERETRPLPRSRITNPFFAAYITSFVRAVLGEIMNALPASTTVLSCTTDGFLTDANEAEAEIAQQGELGRLFRDTRQALTGKPAVLEIKHQIAQPLGWRTRGQATLKPGPINPKDPDSHIVLAKCGIYTEPELETDEDQNAWIVKLFFERTPEQKIRVATKTGVREMIEFDADLVEKHLSRTLNMEFDWKRQPSAFGQSIEHNHLVFNTVPWHSVEEFRQIREFWQNYLERSSVCLKTVDDLERFRGFVATSLATPENARRYLRTAGKTQPDISRLRITLCSAFKHRQAGLDGYGAVMTDGEFAATLELVGIPCERSHVEYGLRKDFRAFQCPPTPACIDAVDRLKDRFPDLRYDEIFGPAPSTQFSKVDWSNPCPFVDRCCEPDLIIAVPKVHHPLAA